MKEQNHLSLESKCDEDDETWHDPLAKFKIRQPPIFVNKLESSFSFQPNHHNKQPKRDGTNDENKSYQPKLKPPSFRRPWKPKLNETGIKHSRAPDDGDAPLQVQNGHLSDHRNLSSSIGPPKTHQGMTLPKLPDMALLRRLNTERQRATKGSLETAQRVIRHVPRKLRRTIHQPSRILGVVEEQKPPDMCEEKAPEPETKAPQTSRWKDFYVGSVPLPSAPNNDATPSEPITSIIKHLPVKNETEDSVSTKKVVEKERNTSSRFSQRLQTAGADFNQTSKKDERWQIQKDLPSLLEKSYSFSPVGLRSYGKDEPSSSHNESASFLNHLQFIIDGKASPTADITQTFPANLETELKNNDSFEGRHRMETSTKRPPSDPKSRARPRAPKQTSARRCVGVEVQTSKSHAAGCLSTSEQEPRMQASSVSTCKVETRQDKPSIMQLLQHKVVVTFSKFKGDRLVLAIVFVMLFGQIGKTRKNFFETRRSEPIHVSSSSGNSIPILKEYFYLKAVSHHNAAKRDDRFDNRALDGTVFRRKSNTIMTPIEDLHQKIIQPNDNNGGEDMLSRSSPFVVSRNAMRRFGNNNSKNQLDLVLPILHHQKENFVIKKVLRSIAHPVVFIFRSGKKILRSAAAALLLALD